MATAKFNPNKLPDFIKIDDIMSGRIDPQLIYQELNRLKVELNILRNDMNNFLKVLIDIPTNANGDINEHEYFKIISSRLKTLKETINEYCLEYNRLLPIINLAQIKLGHEVEILPLPNNNKANSNTANGNTGSTTTNGMVNNNNINSKRNSVVKNAGSNATIPTTSTANGGKAGANVNQPIVL
ncbi:hypothetical protein DFJ63DRAFT_71534 [Scheffersomyces coipomensis]|uniref:uncharacterized protein n=1 Tax=Scheffersomyces coipomensis TaxID=1788519 RepID=UPI00315C7226